MLPPEWDDDRKCKFLAWLTGATGILLDHADNTVTFTHLSFQEFLAAWHLYATIRDPRQIADRFIELMHDSRWSETLLLWSALVSGQDRDTFATVMQHLLGQPNGISLTGMMLVDGIGTNEVNDAWAARFATSLADGWPSNTEDISQGWKNSNEVHFRSRVLDSLSDTAERCGW